MRFAYRLAKELGIWDVEAWLTRMSYDQLRMWAAYASLEPFGAEREDHRAGTIAAVIANTNRDSKRTPTPYTASTFFPSLDHGRGQRAGRGRRVPITDPAEWSAIMRQAKTRAGGKD